MPVVTFFDGGGYRIEKGKTLQVAAIYDNPSGKMVPQGAMGIVVGYFLPEDDRQMLALRRSLPPKPGGNTGRRQGFGADNPAIGAAHCDNITACM